MKRQRGECPTCGRKIAVKIGVGPYAEGRGEVMEHKGLAGRSWADGYCKGGTAIRPERKG